MYILPEWSCFSHSHFYLDGFRHIYHVLFCTGGAFRELSQKDLASGLYSEGAHVYGTWYVKNIWYICYVHMCIYFPCIKDSYYSATLSCSLCALWKIVIILPRYLAHCLQCTMDILLSPGLLTSLCSALKLYEIRIMHLCSYLFVSVLFWHVCLMYVVHLQRREGFSRFFLSVKFYLLKKAFSNSLKYLDH